MLVYDPLHPIQSGVLQLIARTPYIEVAELIVQLKVEYNIEVSKQNLYKIIARLLEDQVLIKQKQGLSLNQPWLENLIHFATEAKNNLIDREIVQNVFLEEGERRVYMVESLAAVDAIWGHLMGTLCEVVHEKEYFAYHPHPYYRMGMVDTESRYWNSIHKKGITIFQLFGNTTFLDRYFAETTPMPGTKDFLVEKPPFPSEGYLLNVYGEYMTEVYMANEIVSRFKYFYEQVTELGQLDIARFNDVFKMKAPVKLVYRRSKKDAEHMKEKFVQAFNNY